MMIPTQPRRYFVRLRDSWGNEYVCGTASGLSMPEACLRATVRSKFRSYVVVGYETSRRDPLGWPTDVICYGGVDEEIQEPMFLLSGPAFDECLAVDRGRCLSPH